MTPKDTVEGWRERFEKNRPQTDNELLASHSASKMYQFGYKHMVGDTIYEVTDWGNIATFIQTELDLTLTKERARVNEVLEGMKIDIEAYRQELIRTNTCNRTNRKINVKEKRAYNQGVSDAQKRITDV